MDFSSMLERGLGRAVIFLRDNDSQPFRETILHACTHFFGYDAQTEPTRGRYLYDIIQATGDPDWYVPQVIELLARGEEEEVETPHTLLELVSAIAEKGDIRAHAAVHAAFARSAKQSGDYGAEEVVTLDGIEGYFSVARQWMKYPRAEEDHWYEGWLLDFVEKKHGQEQLRSALQSIQAVEPALMEYVEQAREKRRIWKKKCRERPVTPAPTYEELKQRTVDPTQSARRYPWWRWGKEIDDKTLEKLANDLQAVSDRGPLLKLLYLFSGRAYPVPPDRILELARSPDATLASAARQALTKLTHPAIRGLALELIVRGEEVSDAVDLLRHNYEAGDYDLLTTLMQHERSRDEFHSLGISLRALIAAYPMPEATPLLVHLYEDGFCAMCRCGVVELLLSLGTLPKAYRNECRLDCYTETRNLMAD